MKPNIVIATPTYGGVIPQHVSSLLALHNWLTAQGLRVGGLHMDMTEIARARNKLATQFLERPEATHLLFIDSDIVFEPAAVEALLRADRPVVGAVYPKRALHLERLIEAARRLTDERQIIASALDFVFSYDGDNAEVVDGRCSVAGIGMGLCLIQRTVFTDLLATGKIRQDSSAWATSGLEGSVYGFFDPIIDGAALVSEDISFCRRWRELCGGEVWAVLDQDIGHVGPMMFRGRLIDALEGATHSDKPVTEASAA